MDAMELSFGAGVLYCVQTLGVVSVVLARLAERSALQSWCQGLFLLALGLMGLATAATFTLGPGLTLASGATLAVMAIAAVCELRPTTNLESF